jgi:hypothetical protein
VFLWWEHKKEEAVSLGKWMVVFDYPDNAGEPTVLGIIETGFFEEVVRGYLFVVCQFYAGYRDRLTA